MGKDNKWKDFKQSSIVRIELNNFMIYKHVEFRPGPFLNLILGPNGSGKSAIVCSIIMGFGGDPQVTGRSSNLIDYIRFGSHSASILIEVYSGNPSENNHIIQRDFKIVTKNAKKECISSWKLNGRTVNKNDISSFIKGLNIDINNLCQVLPQERVVEFSRMSPKQLLVSTEKSIGDVDMYDTHMKLISLSSEIEELQQKIKDTNSFILKYQNFKSNIEPDLKLIKQKQKFEEEIVWLEKKRVWLEYEEKRLTYINTKDEFTKKKAEYKSFSEKVKPVKARLENCDKFLRELKHKKANADDYNQKLSIKINDLTSKQDYYNDKISDFISKFNEKVSEQRRIKSRLCQYEQDLKNYKNDLLNYSDTDKFEMQFEALQDELNRIDNEIREIRNEIDSKQMKYDKFIAEKRRLENKNRSMNDLFNQKLEKLCQRNSDSRVAYEWLNNNKDRFKAEVYPPLITQINVLKPEWVKFVESAIGSNDMSTFLFEDIDDLKYFVKNLEKDCDVRVNVAMIPRDHSNTNYERTFDLEEYKSYGIFASVSDLFTAPQKIMSYLCKNYYLNQIPVGNDVTETKIQSLLESSNFRRIITHKSLFNVVVSKYDNEKSTRIGPLNEAKFLNIIVDVKEIKKIEESLITICSSMGELEKDLVDLNAKQENLKEKFDNKNDECNSFKSKKDALLLIETKIKEKERQISVIKASLQSMSNFKDDLKKNLAKVHQNQQDLLLELTEQIQQSHKNSNETIIIAAKIRIVTDLKFKYQQCCTSLTSDEKRLRNELVELEENLQTIRNVAKEYREKAKQLSGFDFSDNVDTNITERFNNMPSSLSEINDSINMLKLRCEGIANIDESILEEYQKYQNEITEKTSFCRQLENQLELKDGEINTIKPNWLDSLNGLINKINTNYSKFMDYLHFSGEVYLFTGNKEYAFDEYGIRIKVKFRDSEPMKDLDAYHQSGGERSVSTMIYMLSLQELANVPFRVVDEINQGMDETNERCVFDLISQVSRNNSSQYFLLSPKLLPDLNYTDEMKVHIIFNGPHIYVNWNNVLDNLLTKV